MREQRVGPGGQSGRDLARHGEHLASFLEREVGRDQRATSLAGLDDDRRGGQAGDDAVARRKTPRGGLDARCVLRHDEPALRDAPCELGVGRRVHPVDSAAENGDRQPAGLERAAMGLAVDTAREAADDDETGGGQLAAERPRDRGPVR